MLLKSLPLCFLLIASCRVSGRVEYDPTPNPKSVVVVAVQARFTILTSHLVRMEWGGNRDMATLAFVHRNLLSPQYNVSVDKQWTVIKTLAMTVRIKT